MTPSVPLGQALAQAREIEALREHARVYLAVVVDQDDEITALKANVRALAEALRNAALGRHAWHDDAENDSQEFKDCTTSACKEARTALSRPGVVGGREEEKT
jgi:hypothetical protein